MLTGDYSSNKRMLTKKMRLSTGMALIATLLTFLPTAFGKSSDRNQPMEIRSDHGNLSMEENSDSILEGNVTITQGTLEIRAAHAIVHRGKDDIESVTLSGRPAEMKQINDNGEPINAQAASISYSLVSDLILLSGQPTIMTPRGSITGEPIKYDLKTGRLNSGGTGSRVSMRIIPKNKASEEPKP